MRNFSDGAALPVWYEKNKFLSFTLLEVKEGEVSENDGELPEWFINRLELVLQSRKGELLSLVFYNYRLERKDFEDICPPRLIWRSDSIYQNTPGRLYLEIELADPDRKRMLEFSFEDSRIVFYKNKGEKL